MSTATVTVQTHAAMLAIASLRQDAEYHEREAGRLGMVPDSRDTHLLVPRLLRSVADAMDVAVYGGPDLAAGDHFRYPEEARA